MCETEKYIALFPSFIKLDSNNTYELKGEDAERYKKIMQEYQESRIKLDEVIQEEMKGLPDDKLITCGRCKGEFVKSEGWDSERACYNCPKCRRSRYLKNITEVNVINPHPSA